MLADSRAVSVRSRRLTVPCATSFVASASFNVATAAFAFPVVSLLRLFRHSAGQGRRA